MFLCKLKKTKKVLFSDFDETDKDKMATYRNIQNTKKFLKLDKKNKK